MPRIVLWILLAYPLNPLGEREPIKSERNGDRWIKYESCSKR